MLALKLLLSQMNQFHVLPLCFMILEYIFLGYECHTFIVHGRNTLRELLFAIRIFTYYDKMF